jgi:hypothetical protein
MISIPFFLPSPFGSGVAFRTQAFQDEETGESERFNRDFGHGNGKTFLRLAGRVSRKENSVVALQYVRNQHK